MEERMPLYRRWLVNFVLLLTFLVTVSEEQQGSCGSGYQLCGDECISALDFCTYRSSPECLRSTSCADGTCVDPKAQCSPAYCGAGQKRCFSSGKCISRSRKCCTLFYQECSDGACVPFFGDKYCECPALRPFHCSNRKCINTGQVCNGWNDCGDNSDEMQCSTAKPEYVTPKAETSGGIGTSSIVISACAAFLFLVVMFTCLAICCRRKPRRRSYWRRRERSFSEQSPAARTAETLVRSVRNQAPVVVSPPYTQQPPVACIPPPSIQPTAAPPPYPSTPPSDDLPPSYDDVIKDKTAAGAAPVNTDAVSES